MKKQTKNKMMGKVILCILFTAYCLYTSINSYSQGAAINATGTPADPSAILDVSSHTQGVLISRMSTTERNAIYSPVEGLLVFNTDTKCFESYVYGAWSTLSCPVVCNTPGAAGTISGDKSTVCAGDSYVNYNVSPIPNATGYIWVLPPGASINAGSNTYNSNSVYVDFSSSASSGNIIVFGTNGPCFGVSSASYPITVDYPSGVTGTIIGPATVCQGQTESYSVFPIPGATGYAWSYSGSNVTINGATNPVTIDFSGTATSGLLTVAGNSACGMGAASADFPIMINSGTPATVSIAGVPSGGSICSEITFTATATNGGASPVYQWQLNGSDVGTNSSVYTNSTLVNGDKVTCILTTNICSPATSNTITVNFEPVAMHGSGSTDNSITANWHPATVATTYFLDVSTDINFGSFVPVYNNLNVGADTSFTVTGLSAQIPCGTTYYYRIRAENACGTTGNSNQIKYYTSLGTVTTGGTITNVGGYTIHTFTTSGTFTSNCDREVEVLVVAGSGGGSGNGGGGGGGGGVVYQISYPVVFGSISVTVGAGGAGQVNNPPNNGENSVFGTLTAIGGGGGGSRDSYQPGNSGGSGGGGDGGTGGSPGSGTSGQGNDGGKSIESSCNSAGGGGGGAGSTGGIATIQYGGYGGNGISYFGNTYGGGGGGGITCSPGTGGAGGTGGGGAGSAASTGSGSAGTDGLGGGGGGGGSDNANSGNGGNGGSGVVIIRY